MSEMTYEFVHISQGNLPRLLPEMMKRANGFNDKYNDGLDPNLFQAQLVHQAYQNAPTMLSIAILEGEDVIGHCIVCLDEYYGERYAVVMQLEVDKGKGNGNVQEFLKQGIKAIDEWTKANGCTYQRIWARNKAAARMFSSLGFKDTGRVLMERRLLEQPPEES